MGTRTIIPFGPQHPVLPEPIHLDLVLEDEKVVEALPSIGFIHRGLERLAEVKDYNELVFVAERICGICSFIHSQGYSQGVEELLKVEVPPRAKYLRTIWAELSRIHSHILWLGLFADGFGFESLFMHCWRVREKIVDIIEETAGGRVIFGSCKVGGTRRDISNDTLKRIKGELALIEAQYNELIPTFTNDSSVKRRTVGIGVLAGELALQLGAVGPTLRGSGVSSDLRKLGYAAYNDLQWEPVVEKGGDCYARMIVRVREVTQSFDMIRQAIDKIPEGPHDVKVSGNPTGEFFSRLEQPRGEVVYYVKGNGTKNLERFRIRTPTFANIAPLVIMLKGCELPDVPVIVLTIDPCISCTER
ncbi:MAG: nickel-dependent hydrogenase large subunit [Chitinispirillaceae bacterium]|jgi:ech hydrogenase subunit E|nr:nickel-dependent hydrogenase large subunit [Chitinispirillaceae bacterium]